MTDLPRLIVADRLRTARRERGLTQDRLAKQVGLSRETVYRIERGRLPFGNTALRLCDPLGLDREELNLEQRETDSIHSHPSNTYLRDRRRSLGLTLKEVAAAAEMRVATLSRFERGA